MFNVKKLLKRSYIYVILALFYIPLIVGVIYSFSASATKSDMPLKFQYTGEGWKNLAENEDVLYAIVNTALIALIVSTIVAALALLTVFGLWRQNNRVVKGYIQGTSNVPLINPDVITAISMAIAFGAMFGTMQMNDTGYERLIISQVTMILPFGITIMYPKSEKFKASLFEASKDLGFGPVRTWFKTYFRFMLPVTLATFVIAIAMSFDDFIITRIVSKEVTVSKKMYEGSLKPWVLAMGTIVMTITLSLSVFRAVLIKWKERKLVKGKK